MGNRVDLVSDQSVEEYLVSNFGIGVSIGIPDIGALSVMFDQVCTYWHHDHSYTGIAM